MESLPRVFDMLQYTKQFCLQWEAFDLLNKMRYILWVVSLLLTCNVTNNRWFSRYVIAAMLVDGKQKIAH